MIILEDKMMKKLNTINPSVEAHMTMILKGAAQVVSPELLQKKIERAILENKPLTVKLGLDPSAPDIHLGHAVVLRKMKQLQDLGHKIVIIIGDFTGKIGDPTGKSKGRKALTTEEVIENAQTYTNQIFKILNQEQTEVRFNSEWLSTMNFEEVVRLASTVTLARMLERDDFEKRFDNQVPIGLHEFFYPLMQAQDSVALRADIELGGTDQTFNILMGRTLQKSVGQEEQVALFMPILEGLDGVEKMSKSLGNYIGINESAIVMFKKVMEVPDSLIIKFFDLATDLEPSEIEVFKERLSAGENPKNIKLELARQITRLYHSEEQSLKGEQFFEEAFTDKSLPSEVPELTLENLEWVMVSLGNQLLQRKVIKSLSAFRRLIEQGGVLLNGEKVEKVETPLKPGDWIRVGKKQFFKIVEK